MQITKEVFDEALEFVKDFEVKAKANNEFTMIIHNPPLHVLKAESETGDFHEDGTEGALIAEMDNLIDGKEIKLCFVMYETETTDSKVLFSVTMAYKLLKTGLYVDVV